MSRPLVAIIFTPSTKFQSERKEVSDFFEVDFAHVCVEANRVDGHFEEGYSSDAKSEECHLRGRFDL